MRGLVKKCYLIGTFQIYAARNPGPIRVCVLAENAAFVLVVRCPGPLFWRLRACGIGSHSPWPDCRSQSRTPIIFPVQFDRIQLFLMSGSRAQFWLASLCSAELPQLEHAQHLRGTADLLLPGIYECGGAAHRGLLRLESQD